MAALKLEAYGGKNGGAFSAGRGGAGLQLYGDGENVAAQVSLTVV